MSGVGRKDGKGAAEQIVWCRDVLGPTLAAEREAEIAALPIVVWKGRTLKTIRCCGTTGKGPHDYNVPESTLWSLISLKEFHCVYHPR